jgi:hypothetical protein
MFFIKKTIITKIYLNRLFKYLTKSTDNANILGSYIAQLNYQLSINRHLLDNGNQLYNDILLNIINNDANHIFNKILSPYITYGEFFKYFNYKLLKQKKIHIFSFFRGYYLCDLNLYSTNLISNVVYKYSYFVLYDFHPIYLEYIYKHALTLENAKYIHIYNKTDYDKYSINDITDDISYKLVIKYKSKFYNKIFYNFMKLFFYNIYNTNTLKREDEIALYYKYLLN